MRRILPLLCSLLLIAATATAQYNPYWRWAIADTNNAQQSNGLHHVTAAFNGKAFWGRLKRVGLQSGAGTFGDYVVSVQDSAGLTMIASPLLGKVTLLDAHADAAGNWYILGAYYDSLRTTNGQLYLRNPTGTDPDHFLARLDAGSLNTSWIKFLGSSNASVASCFNISANVIYVPVDDATGTQILAFNNANGNANLLFAQGGKSATSSIAVEPGGAIMLAGSCSAQGINFNGVQQAPVAGNNFPAYLVRYTANGQHRWHYWLEDNNCVSRGVNVAPGHIIYYTGSLHNAFMLGTQSLHAPVYTYDYVAARLDTSGNVAWVRQIDTSGGGDASLDLAHLAVVTPDTALAIFALTRNFIDWRDNVSTDASQYYNAAVVSFGKDGHTRWARLIKGNFTGNEQIATDGSDVVWVTGSGYTALNYLLFDTTHLYVQPLSYNPYLAKLKLTALPVTSTGITGVGGDDGLRISPNPATRVLRLSFAALSSTARVMLRDITGRTLLSREIAERETILDVSGFAKGLYLLEINVAGTRRVERILLQ